MKNRKVLLVMAIVSGVISGIIYNNRYFNDLGTFLFLFSSVLSIVFIVLYFINSITVFRTWNNFSIVYLMVATVLAMIAPSSPGFLSPDSEMISFWLAVIFFVVSIGIIIFKKKEHQS